ncbi:MAG: EAL domain-containing protein [Betaproteobacteria bacterium]|nr:EAL domain-containing protein [Betaproteobacteria bacterium]MBK7080924.1 EAL domain-containing protein [Betaproteobacteria bacterium]MBK7590195.1 EAL domain-containing protein [Betaproteobacteria bacterium]MBK7743993.1 EAL domain-containing protein [Betaproteobacteria bacterium]MBK8687374.1 EAL domain-containing protein [Betaproteobacteria bacterium]
MTHQTIYLARQPIVDVNKELVGFELLFRATARNASEETDNVFATSTVIANTFTEIGLDQVVGNVDGYLNVDNDFLFSDLIEALPASRIVLELLENTIADERTIARVAELRKLKYRVAIDDFIGNFDDLDALLPAVDIIKIDFLKLDALLVPMIVELLGKHQVTLVAEKVETPEQFRQAKELGITLFQGYHFARPEVLTAKRSKPAKLALLRLLSLAMNEAETRDIEEEFKHHPTLTVNLLRLVNSAALGRRQVVTSLRHALVLLGRRQLRVWLQLLLYTSDRDNRSLNSPLLQVAAARGKLMEQLAVRDGGTQSALKDLAFMTGILSLMDVLLEMPLAEILKGLNVPVPVEAALLRREGTLGALLGLTEQIEQDDGAGIAASLQKVPGTMEEGDLVSLQLAAYRWANEVATAV